MIHFVVGPGVITIHEFLMTLPNFCVIVFGYAEMQATLFDYI